MINIGNEISEYISHKKDRVHPVRFKRVETGDLCQYFDGYKIQRINSVGKIYTYYIVCKCYSVDMYKSKWVEVDNVFKGVEFLRSEILILN